MDLFKNILKRPVPGLSQRINYLLVLIFVLFLPFNNRFFTYLFILWTIVSIYVAYVKRIAIKDILNSSLFYLIFYSISILSLLYSEDISYGIKNLETMVSLIIFPFLLLTIKRTENARIKDHIFKAYILGLILYIFVTIVLLFIRWDIKSITNYLETNTFWSAASYFQLSLFLQKSYISMYLIWGIVLIVDFLLRGKSLKAYIIGISVISVFLIYIIILGSRAALITLPIILVFYLWKLLQRYSLWVRISLTMIVLIFITGLMLKHTRIGETVVSTRDAPANDIRISLWVDAFEVFKDKPVYGHGIGDGVNEMVLKHKENGIKDAYVNRLNAHNQFLETATQTGMIGFLSLLLILIVPLINSIKNKQELMFLFIIIAVVNFLFESMLVRLAGVLFLGFWLSFLSIIQNSTEQEFNTDVNLN